MFSTTNQHARILKVEEGLKSKNKEDYLRPYFATGDIQPATIPRKSPWIIKNQPNDIPMGWVVWSFKTYENNSGYINEISADNRIITEYVPENEEDYYDSTYTKDLRLRATRVVFMKSSNKAPWRFMGVFVPDFEQTKPSVHVFKRISTEVIVETEPQRTIEIPFYIL